MILGLSKGIAMKRIYAEPPDELMGEANPLFGYY